ncbi:MarR family winged helix-turn-helix transcriptional regulator [Gluconacetobacter sacchari]|uniref:MarR family transcriptional regulator n=2 Tax=Gluconacetobacter sacchari TaxID=92759 RepID=A0A7W4IG01_9PROT|nr:MarR family transcriptional regulator [Gluconacetobacter sacchari]MBB2162145.1 MarR family transcriptional regulator [Gluconacetobacter sacchari]GBQ25390.1 transcriptional regulator [Gluconacetobacter sacchari DSM 12717]
MATVLDADAMAAIELMFALRSAVQGLDNVFTRWLEKDELTPGRWQVLVVLWAADGPIPHRVIVQALKVSRATVSGLVEALLAQAYVEVAEDPQDRRQVLVALTPKGERTTLRLLHENTQLLQKIFRNIKSDIRKFETILSRIDIDANR